MADLWLNFKDADGTDRRERVEGQKFIIGRHSESDLSIADGRLSREHLAVERYGDVFVASDCGSSNGTKINGEPLSAPTAVKDGDVFDLGGLVFAAEFDDPNALPLESAPAEPAASAVPLLPEAGEINNAIPTSIFLIAPLIGLVVVASAFGLFYFTRGSKNEAATANDFVYSSRQPKENPSKTKENENASGTAASAGAPPVAQTANNAATLSQSSPLPVSTETGKVEQNGTAFLRLIAQNDNKAFLTGEQAQKVNAKIKQLAENGALAANISSARQNSAAIRSAATAANLKPQFLAIAAIAKLGSARGDIGGTVRSMTPILEKLRTQLGSELSDDTLLMIAAYDQGEAGDSMRLRNSLQDLATKYPESSRSIRTVWFLQENGKITPAEFDSVLAFLAIGTISQNPKDFGVNAEALTF
ncbi:MAG: FHA domain-containing protein [Pyrinomonadaceae bacterium]